MGFRLYRRKGKKTDSWILDTRRRDVEGERRVIGHTDTMTKEEAEEIRVKAESEYYLKKSGIEKQNEISTQELFDLFIKFKQGEVRPTSILKYSNHLKFWITKHPQKFFPLSIVEIETYLQELISQGLSNATINSYLTTLKQLYNYAQKRKFLQDNTASQVRRLKKKPRKPPRYFTEEELGKILSYDTPYREAFIVLLYTGMRRNELRFLEWTDVSFENKTIHIKNKEGFVTKTGQNRVIPMHPKIERILLNREQESGFVFGYSTGNPHHRNKWNDSLRRILKKENIPNASIHTFRHTFATRFLH